MAGAALPIEYFREQHDAFLFDRANSEPNCPCLGRCPICGEKIFTCDDRYRYEGKVYCPDCFSDVMEEFLERGIG